MDQVVNRSYQIYRDLAVFGDERFYDYFFESSRQRLSLALISVLVQLLVKPSLRNRWSQSYSMEYFS